jgi:hypothetical protein
MAALLTVTYIAGFMGEIKTVYDHAGGSDAFLRVEKRELGKEAVLVIKLKRLSKIGTGSVGDTAVALGPHLVELRLNGNTNSCPYYARYYVRLVGDALVGVDLEQVAHDSKLWRGSFSLPMAGSFVVDARSYGCSFETKQSWIGLDRPIEFESADEGSFVDVNGGSSLDSPLFASSAWVANTELGSGKAQYVWKRLKKEDLPENAIRLPNQVPVVVEGTAREPGGLHMFHDLGNYELVCFLGSQSMNDIHSTFLALRPHLANGQRPFKFHYYNVTDLVHPDKEWNLERKEKIRKCKHILVSVDEMANPVSQSEYRTQMTKFIGHLLNLMNDDTFPIWIFTVNESPMLATNCFAPNARTSDHPCNTVLKDLFRSNMFSERVHLLDNTDLSLPQLEENRNDVFAIIALRVFVVVGKQVAEWRAVGQRGLIDGLHRNGSIEPNFKLLPYEGWA